MPRTPAGDGNSPGREGSRVGESGYEAARKRLGLPPSSLPPAGPRLPDDLDRAHELDALGAPAPRDPETALPATAAQPWPPIEPFTEPGAPLPDALHFPRRET